jgi:predicted Zn finger-like uncharacterized protein
MAIEALCPTCGAVFNLKDEYEGKKVRCKKCEQIFTVAAGKAADRDDDRGSVKTKADDAPARKSTRDDDDDERSSRKVRPAAKRGRDDDDDDDRPKRKASKRGRDDDDDDDNDRSRKRKRTYHDDDDDDDDRPRKRSPKRASGGGAGKVLLIVGGVVALVILVCGGAIYGVYKVAADAADEAEAQQQQWQNAMNNGGPGNPWQGGGFPGFEQQPHDMTEALTFLKGNDPNARRGAANWLSNQPLDAGKQKEVATALESLVKDSDDNTCAAGAKAMKVWGTKDNGPALTTALRSRLPGGNRPFLGEDQKQLMGAIAAVKYEPGADVIAEFLPNFFSGGEAEIALGNFGAGAEKPVLKHFHDPDGNCRGKARGLCLRYGTKPLVMLDQTVIDLAAIDRGRSGAALEWLSRGDSNDALQAANADPARRTAVAQALNKVIDDPQFNGDQVFQACKRWATKDNIPALSRKRESDVWKKKEYSDLIIAVGGAEAKFDVALTDLKSGDNRRIQDAARVLQTTPVDEKQRAAVVAGLLGAINGDGFFQGNDTCEAITKALAVWATRDDGAAVVDKVSQLKKPFLTRARGVTIDWLGKQKVEKGIVFLAGLLADRDEYQAAGSALIAMGPDLGDKIEVAVSTVQTTDKNQLLQCFKVLGAVGTKQSLNLLKSQQALFLQKKDLQLAQACKDASDAITLRGK